MTAKEAKCWAESRMQGRLRYTLRQGLVFAACFGAVFFLFQLLAARLQPWTFTLFATTVATTIYTLLTYFRWSYLEFQFYLFNKSQACSESVSRA